ncbi:ABC transporter substrate-binding protein [Mesorhizobium sp. M00.F.Ca.ET.216.01.1.1]|nr:ABC transporter substrate-binding protein [Mesorhizobium sp. M00.F.Ca.ET.216.01.1.1]
MNNRILTARNIHRRSVLAGAATATAAAMLGPLSRPVLADDKILAGKQIRVLTWADATGRAAVENIIKPFEEATGARVIADLTGTTSEMVAKIKASAARPQYDVVILSGVGAIELASAGLLARPDTAKIPNLERVLPEYRSGANGFGVGYYLWSDGLVYNTKTFASPPDSYAVLWDEKTGKIFVPPANDLGAAELIIAAARLAGGSEHNPDPGFELLRKLKDRILTFSTNAGQLAELFQSNALHAGAVYSPLQMADFIREPQYNASGTFDLKEGFFVDLQFMVLPKGAPGDIEVAHALLNQALDPVTQGKMAEAVWYGPINQDAQLSETAKQSPYIASPRLIKEKAATIDWDHLASVRADWIKRYTEILTS